MTQLKDSMSNIEKIRQEIKRLKKILEESTYYLDNSQQALGYSFALDDFKEFIDSLSEEKPSEDLEKAADEYAYRGIPDEMKPYVKPVGDEIIKNFIAGANWKKEHSFAPTQEQLDALDTVYKTHGADSTCGHILLNLLTKLKELS